MVVKTGLVPVLLAAAGAEAFTFPSAVPSRCPGLTAIRILQHVIKKVFLILQYLTVYGVT
jgi:hypothetical protein